MATQQTEELNPSEQVLRVGIFNFATQLAIEYSKTKSKDEAILMVSNHLRELADYFEEQNSNEKNI